MDIYTSLNMTNNVKTLYIYTAVSENDVKAAMKAINKTILDVKGRKFRNWRKRFNSYEEGS